MALFDFQHQLESSLPEVKALVDWMTRVDTGWWGNEQLCYAKDCQDLSHLFYWGDVEFMAPKHYHPIFLEVKVESRTTTQTANCAIEQYSDKAKKKLGGPWNTNAGWWANLFADGLLVVMRTKELREFAEVNKGLPTFYAPNRGYTSTGYLIPRQQLARLRTYSQWQIW